MAKKILLLIESMAPESGGPAIEIARLSNHLCKYNHLKITIATTTHFATSIPLHQSIIYHLLPLPQIIGLNWWKGVSQIKQLVDEHDIVCCTGIWGPYDGLALRIAWPAHKPVFIRVCGMLEPYILQRNRWKKWLGWNGYVKHNLWKAATIIVNSQSEAVNIQKLGLPPSKILVLPNGIEVVENSTQPDVARQLLNLPLSEKILLYLGRIHPKKGLHVLLLAITNLPKSIPFTLVVAGEFSDAAYQTQILEIISSGKLQHRVKFTGFADNEKKHLLFQAADGFVLPSESEGLPNAVLEAMANGLPVIITEGCNIPQVADYKAGKIGSFGETFLTEALQWWHQLSPNEQINVGNNGKKLVQQDFNPTTTTAKYNDLFSS